MAKSKKIFINNSSAKTCYALVHGQEVALKGIVGLLTKLMEQHTETIEKSFGCKAEQLTIEQLQKADASDFVTVIHAMLQDTFALQVAVTGLGLDLHNEKFKEIEKHESHLEKWNYTAELDTDGDVPILSVELSEPIE